LKKIVEKKEGKKSVKKVNKKTDTNVQSHYLYFVSLIGLNMCCFTWLHIYLGLGVFVIIHEKRKKRKNIEQDLMTLIAFWWYILFLYNFATWLIGWSNYLYFVHNLPFLYISLCFEKKNPKTFSFVFENILWVFHLKSLTRPHLSTEWFKRACCIR